MPRKETFQCYFTAEQVQALRLLHERTKVPISEFIRQGVDLLLDRRAADLVDLIASPEPEDT